MQNNNKDFLGKGKYGNFGHIRCWIRAENLPTDKDYINIVVKPMKAVDERGNSHAVVIDTFGSSKKQFDNRSSYEKKHDDNKTLSDESNLPF